MTALPWIADDGGRLEAGYKGDAGDCVVRSIAIAAGLPYQHVYDHLAELNQAAAARARTRHHGSPRNGTHRDVLELYLVGELGATWTPTMRIGEGCRVHLAAGEIPMAGRRIVRLSRHMAAVVDGVVHDAYDPGRDGTRCVYGYWTLP